VFGVPEKEEEERGGPKGGMVCMCWSASRGESESAIESVSKASMERANRDVYRGVDDRRAAVINEEMK
jgi:hypothetical protein